jgi:hypothetical protein
MSLPLNRVIAFAGPYISVFAGGVATWIVAKMNVIGVAGLDQDNLSEQIASGLTFTLTAGLAWLGHAQWLKGHHVQMAGDAAVQAAALAVQQHEPRAMEVPPDPVHDALMAMDEDLPDDDEEFAMPPDQDARVAPEFPAAAFVPPPAAQEFATAPQFATVPPELAAAQPEPQFTPASLQPQFAVAPPEQQFATPPPEQQFAPAPQPPEFPEFSGMPQFATPPPSPPSSPS